MCYVSILVPVAYKRGMLGAEKGEMTAEGFSNEPLSLCQVKCQVQPIWFKGSTVQRGSMRRSATFLLFLLILLTVSQVVSAQQTDVKQTAQAESKIRLESEIELLTFQIQRVTEALIKDGQSFQPLERAVLWAHLGNLLWKDDREYGRRMLDKAVEEIETASKQKKSISEPQIGKEQLVNTARIVLRTVSVHDKQLSERLLAILSHVNDDKQSNATSHSDNIAESLVDSALLVLNTNVKRAASLASESLQYGESSKFPLLLISMRKLDGELADGLFNQALAVAQTKQSSNLLLALTYVAFPAVYAPATRDQAPADSLRRSLLRALAAGIMQENQANNGNCIYATSIARLLGEVDRLLPEEAVTVRAAVLGCQPRSPLIEEELSTTPPKTVDDFLDLASKAKTIEMRVFALIRASQLALQQQDFKRAINIIDNLTSDERQVLGDSWEGMRRDMATEAALSYYAKNDPAAVEQIINATPSELRPFVNLSFAEGVLKGKNIDQIFVRERLAMIREGLARREPSFLLYYPYIKLVSLYARVDMPEAFNVLREAVKVINRAGQADKSPSKRTEEIIAGGSLEPLLLPVALVDANAGEIIELIALLESPSLRARARLSVLGSLVEQKQQQMSITKPDVKN